MKKQNAHLVELMPKITAAEAAERILVVTHKAGESLADATKAQERIRKVLKEANGYAEVCNDNRPAP